MDPLDFLEPEQLREFLRRHKTELSCMEKPQTFLNQLRDQKLIPEDRYKKVCRMKSKDNIKQGLYDILDKLEKEQSQNIHLFWSSVFKDTIMNHYPPLRLLRSSLMDGSFQFDTKLPEKVEKEETNERKKKEDDKEEEQGKSVKKRRKRTKRVCYSDDDDDDDDDEEQPGASSQSAPSQRKKSRKICFESPSKKGEKSDIWTWLIYKELLPVTCGSQDGMLSRNRLAKGEKCISFQKQWFTPTEFERFAGKGSNKNWKLSIQCNETPLRDLIQEGHLKPASYKRRNKTKPRLAKKSLFPLTSTEGEQGEEEMDDGDEEDDQDQRSSDVTDEDAECEEQTEPDECQVFKVTCRDVAATLHRKRFGSGTRGKCIRTETSWLTPLEFVKVAASCQTDVSWKRDIKWKEEPINVLIEAKILRIHPLLCECRCCSTDEISLDEQKNDDVCWICKREEEKLVMCDHCPRSFHQKCHLPPVDDADVGDSSPWMCTFCVATQAWRLGDQVETEVALSHLVSPHLMECQYLLLSLYSTDESRKIASISSSAREDSSSVNQTPPWLDSIADNLQAEKYQRIKDFVSDVQHIFTNCASEHQNHPEVPSMVARLKEIFNQRFNSVFNICDRSVGCLH
uniref:nuclear body protein SP140-like protein isoform X1 n=1 Tax=Solea senegalensis TaxID=28829 RepID=UPI001CD8A6BE|nr:nuclear body protein SP140-like protein isoform X1 [Solea senegalensis]